MPFSHSTLKLIEIDGETKEDVVFLVKLRNLSRKFFFNSDLVTIEGTTKWLKGLGLDRKLYLLWFNGERAGTIGYRKLVINGFVVRWLENLALMPEFQGLGLAKWMVGEMRAEGCFVISQVLTDNKKVLRLYEESGFWRARLNKKRRNYEDPNSIGK